MIGFLHINTLPPNIDMIEYWERSSLNFYVWESLKLCCTSQVEILMSDFEEIENSVDEEEMMKELMAEGFGDLASHWRWREAVKGEVIVSNLHHGEPLNDIPEGIPFEPPLPSPLASDFALWLCSISDQGALAFARNFNMYPSIYRVFVTCMARKMST